MLLVRITPPADLAGPLKLAAEANWLVCEDVCIPEEGKFELDAALGAAATPAPPATRALFEQARRSLPTESPWPARYGVSKAGDPDPDRRGQGPEGRHDPRRLFLPRRMGPGRHDGQAEPPASRPTASASRSAEGRRQGRDARRRSRAPWC